MKLTPAQEAANEVLAGPARHILVEGGSRSGKTALLVRAVVIRALKAPGSRHAILRQHFNHCKEAVGMDTLPKVMRLAFPEVEWSMNRSDWFASMPGGSEVWLGGLDDDQRTEKILGKEFATLYLNEASQISWHARNMAVTRLAQVAPAKVGPEVLAPKIYYDLNPPSTAHWAYRVFHQKLDPESKQPLADPDRYAWVRINPRDNAANLSEDYFKELEGLSGRMRKRFLLGEYGEAAPGALWTEELLDQHRVQEHPDLQRVVIGVDPSGASDADADADAIGIVVAGLGTDGNAYVIEDVTCKLGPAGWARVVATTFDRHAADRVVAERNYGGDMVAATLKTAAPRMPVSLVSASRGKAIRAEPIAALYEQGRVRHVGRFAQLEDEMCAMTTTGYVGSGSPNRVDALVWALTELFPRVTRPAVESKPIVRRGISHSNTAWMA